jgi:CRP-like cAMP-binding protein
MLEANIELLKAVPVFRELSHDQLAAIAKAAGKAFFQAGECIIREGETGETAYLIMSGKASCSILQDGEISQQDLWPGTLVGELGMLVETTHHVTVIAQERVRAMAFHREAFHEVMNAEPGIARHISAQLLQRLQNLAQDLRKVDAQLAELEKAA